MQQGCATIVCCGVPGTLRRPRHKGQQLREASPDPPPPGEMSKICAVPLGHSASAYNMVLGGSPLRLGGGQRPGWTIPMRIPQLSA